MKHWRKSKRNSQKKTEISQIYKQNKEIFDNIKHKLINNPKRAEEFYKTFEIYFIIDVDDLTLLFNSKQYELDLKSMIYFFDSLNKDDDWNKKNKKKYKKNMKN